MSPGCVILYTTLSIIILSIHLTVGKQSTPKAIYKYKEYQYKETTKNEMAYREFESACEQNPSCTNKSGMPRVACVRECISPSCYQELYSYDVLEEGEIDVRLNSFKGCFSQRLNRQRQ